MNKKITGIFLTLAISVALLAGCNNNKSKDSDGEKVSTTTQQQTESQTQEKKESLADGTYEAVFNTDSSMFHVNEALDGKGTLTVKDGKMTIHISLVSKKILNLYVGLAEDAKKDGADLLQPTVDSVTYEDGTTEEVYGFDVPVQAIDEEFDLALVGEKGTWYDHKVSVTNPVLKADGEKAQSESEDAQAEIILEDGSYETAVVLEGGSGKSTVTSPCKIKVEDGQYFATIEWSSPNYDYMIVNEEKYLPVNTSGNSTFEIPFNVFDEPVAVQADTVAMSKPHLIDYTLTFDSNVTAR
ncbi:MAG: hypothetical protein IKN54_05080 [Lachnospiraceae bacterium]|nr:hypothetical protein [Lachnospiraceae bacterium]